MSALILNNELVHYEVLGRGRPILFLHSWVGSWRDWILAMQAVSPSYRCYALDLWGFGDTSKARGNYTIDAQARLLDDFITELGIGKVALVGHGLGALVAAHFAAEFPQFVDRLMLVAYPVQARDLSDRLSRPAPGELSQWLLNGIAGAEAVRREASKADPAAITISLADLAGPEHTGRLKKLTQPCLLVYGEDDPIVNPPGVDLLIELNELSHNILLDDVGHYPMLHADARFSRLLKEFLSLQSGESPRSLQLKDEWKRRFR